MQRVSSQRRFKRLVVFRDGPSAILSRANRRPMPSCCMKTARRRYPEALRCSPEYPSRPLSAVPFQQLTLRIPRVTLRSAEARLYRMRRLSGHAHAQPACYRGQTDRRYHGVPSGCLRRPATGENPAATGGCTVIAHWANELSCWPFLTITAPVAGW